MTRDKHDVGLSAVLVLGPRVLTAVDRILLG